MGSKNSNNGRIVFLDFLRIFAFVSVLIGHKFYFIFGFIEGDPTTHATVKFIARILKPVTESGGAGVVVFFLVSGYIIARVLQTENTITFLIKRIFRIYPLYISAVLLEYILVSETSPRSITTLLNQLLLIGDFTDTPYTLGGVEWTLRIEVMFYLFMACCRTIGLMGRHEKWLPYVLALATALCGMQMFPSSYTLMTGSLTLYAPFLFLGSMCYLFESKKIRLTFLCVYIAFTFYQYFTQVALYKIQHLGMHFASIAFCIFLIFWLMRNSLTAPPWVLLLSEMTYAVYLFHNWFYVYAIEQLNHFGIHPIHERLQGLLALFVFCLLAGKLIEKPGINLGRRLLHRIHC